MFPRKKENEKPKTEDRGQNTEELQRQITEMQKQTEGLQKEKDDLFAKLQRLAADYDNYQKRSAKQIADGVAYEKDKLIKSLLPVLDNFEHIIKNASCGVNDETLSKGVQIIYDQILGVLKAQGVEQIKASGEKFNPAMHEAITTQTEKGREDGLVLEELQKGYVLEGRLIRPSRVVVNKVPTVEAEQSEDEETKDTQ